MSKIQFEPNYSKTVEALLYILSKRPTVNLYNCLKITFEADKVHLNKYGRPVTGDTYIRMPYGTVPSFLLDVINAQPIVYSALNIDDLPFTRKGHELSASRQPNMDYLSESDIEAIDAGIAKYINLSFDQVRLLNHKERAWLESPPGEIDFALMIDNPEVLEELQNNPLKLVV